MTIRTAYPTDVTGPQCQQIEPLLPPAKSRGRPRRYELREILNGLFYLLRSGCSRRLLPHVLPPWRIVYNYFRSWRDDGTLERIHDTSRRQVRQAEGRDAEPSAGIVDSSETMIRTAMIHLMVRRLEGK